MTATGHLNRIELICKYKKMRSAPVWVFRVTIKITLLFPWKLKCKAAFQMVQNSYLFTVLIIFDYMLGSTYFLLLKQLEKMCFRIAACYFCSKLLWCRSYSLGSCHQANVLLQCTCIPFYWYRLFWIAFIYLKVDIILFCILCCFKCRMIK